MQVYIYRWHSLIQYIRDIFQAAQVTRRPVVSFEFFPTKTAEGERALLEKTIPALKALQPDFCSVTYGAGGGTREKTLAIVDRIQREQQITAMAHLTCVNATVEDTTAVLAETGALGIKNILALRGDPPSGAGEFVRAEGGFEYSYQLVRHIREFGVTGMAEDFLLARIDRHDAALILAAHQRGDRAIAALGGVGRGADDGDRARVEEGVEGVGHNVYQSEKLSQVTLSLR